MKKTVCRMFASILIVMVLLPLADRIWCKGDAAFALAFILVYAVIPLYMVVLGAVCCGECLPLL